MTSSINPIDTCSTLPWPINHLKIIPTHQRTRMISLSTSTPSISCLSSWTLRMFKEVSIVNYNRFALPSLMKMNLNLVPRPTCWLIDLIDSLQRHVTKQLVSLNDCIIMQFLRFMQTHSTKCNHSSVRTLLHQTSSPTKWWVPIFVSVMPCACYMRPRCMPSIQTFYPFQIDCTRNCEASSERVYEWRWFTRYKYIVSCNRPVMKPPVPVMLKNLPIPNLWKRSNMNPTPPLPNCDKELHLRIPKEFQDNLQRVATSYNLKKSTFVRMILMRELNNYDKSRLFAWWLQKNLTQFARSQFFLKSFYPPPRLPSSPMICRSWRWRFASASHQRNQ